MPSLDLPRTLKAPDTRLLADGTRILQWGFREHVMGLEFLRFMEENVPEIGPRIGVVLGRLTISFTYSEAQAMGVVFCCYLVGQLHKNQLKLKKCWAVNDG